MQTLKACKVGDDFEISYSLPIAFGSSIASIKSQIRTNDNENTLIQTLSVASPITTITDKSWIITATSTQTASWPVKILKMDIQHTSVDGKIISSDTFLVPISKGSTI